MAVYVVDRLVRRYRRPNSGSLVRQVELEVEVSDPTFWNPLAELVGHALRQVSDDFWTVRFVRGGSAHISDLPLPLADQNPIVCLYSGGLDSASGLATRLRDVTNPVVTVTALHQHGQKKRVQEQVKAFAGAYGRRVHPLVLRTTMMNPPSLKQQELSQRCRAFLFTALGGAVASLTGSREIEVFESGVGAINLPPMAGMVSGGRTTKGCHPQFLRLMGELVSHVAQREIKFTLPFKAYTKAQIVRTLREDHLSHLAAKTVSCVHYPLREKGTAKQCGVCMGCIGRRQSLIQAGVPEDAALYKHDLFDSVQRANAIPVDELSPLKAMLMQVAELEELSADGQKPELFRRYVFGTQLLAPNEPVEQWVEVMRRYREEWMDLIAEANSRGIGWAKLLPEPELSA
jgi:7-cyano-7-deazaguanine synthase in queuosine biosynthesis